MNWEDHMVGMIRACASCRHQRKRCDGINCEYAAYFPAERYNEFQNAQRLFGVSNIHKILNAVEPNQKKHAAESILLEGNIRSDDPVHGCLGVIRNIKQEIEYCEEQLELTNQQLAFLRQRDEEVKRKTVELPPLPMSSVAFHEFGDPSFSGGHILTNPISEVFSFESMMKGSSSHHGYYYQSTAEEASNITKPFDFFHMLGPSDNSTTVETMTGAQTSVRVVDDPNDRGKRVLQSGGGNEKASAAAHIGLPSKEEEDFSAIKMDRF